MLQESYSDDESYDESDFISDSEDENYKNIININNNSQTIYIHNYKNYNVSYIDDNMILTPIIPIKYISEYTLLQPKYLTHSKIIKCSITYKDKVIYNTDNTNISFRNILVSIYKQMSISTIFKNTTFNFKLTNENGKNGYSWCKELGFSIQGKDSNETMKEIINMVKINKYNINISIKLSDDTIVNFKN